MQTCDWCHVTLSGAFFGVQNKLITVTPETKVLRAMELMTGELNGTL